MDNTGSCTVGIGRGGLTLKGGGGVIAVGSSHTVLKGSVLSRAIPCGCRWPQVGPIFDILSRKVGAEFFIYLER